MPTFMSNKHVFILTFDAKIHIFFYFSILFADEKCDN